jgi:hypothetical protein
MDLAINRLPAYIASAPMGGSKICRRQRAYSIKKNDPEKSDPKKNDSETIQR